jgi:farnesyl-diphosphate farnesyltransferase
MPDSTAIPYQFQQSRGMSWEAQNRLLKGVSRSFYLSLRLLPPPMRGAASLGYLLARSSDTLADTSGAPVEARLLCLDWFGRTVAGEEPAPRWPMPVLNAVGDPRERRLLEETRELIAWLERLPAGEAKLVREVAATIIGGQRLDLERFGCADEWHPVALENDAALEDYAWRVAGCVGAFWTKLGQLTMGARFSRGDRTVLLENAVAYGKGLQLVNILRDLPADLACGRCYLPVADPQDVETLMAERVKWIAKTRDWLECGLRYPADIGPRRLRVASVLPAKLAVATLDRVERADWETLCRKVRVPRWRVYRMLATTFLTGR